MQKVDHFFRLSASPHEGVWCGRGGASVGGVSLVEQAADREGGERWRPRLADDLSFELTRSYGFPVDALGKMTGLAAVAQGLNDGDLARTQVILLHLQFPDPPSLAKGRPPVRARDQLQRQLKASGLLKAGWDPNEHPRWPAGSEGGVGGEFAPGNSGATLTHAQITWAPEIIEPWVPRLVLPKAPTMPSEIVPPISPTMPKDLPLNPYPDRPECEQEWAQAKKYCLRLSKERKMGKDGYRGLGWWIEQCMRGQVSEGC
ncbi:MAG: hypothetical protein ACYDD1_02945, partial [Caulobacteraceae bacterium]